MRTLSWIFITSAFLMLVGCSGASNDTSAAGGMSGAGGSGVGGSGVGGSGVGGSGVGGSDTDGGTDAGSEACSATFTWLQKDAYKNTAGRSSELWPPHTTTTFDIVCAGIVVRSTFRENHGTKPGEVDANGDVYLVKVASKKTSGSRAALDVLADTYESCECSTKFLSLNSLGDTTIQLVIKELSDYIVAHLTCTGSVDANGLVTMLQAGDIQGVLGVLPNCTWSSGFGWSNGFDTALQKIIATAQEALLDYHVCNNDAELQAGLFEDFANTGQPGTCNGDSPLCHGPKWFYTPTP
jgi:hypothetical protein